MCGRKKKPEPHEHGLPHHDRGLYYPTPFPRLHGPGCAMELALLEKHSAHCRHNKIGGPDRNPIDDDIGNFYVVGRVGYETCARPCGKGLAGGSDGSHIHHSGSARRSSAMSRSRSREPSYMSSIYEEDGGSHTTSHHRESFRHSHSPSRSTSRQMGSHHASPSRHGNTRNSMAHRGSSRVPSVVLEESERALAMQDVEPAREISVESPSGNVITVRSPSGPDEYGGPPDSEIQISVGRSGSSQMSIRSHASPRKSVAYPSPSSLVAAQSAPSSRSSTYYSSTDATDPMSGYPGGHRASARQSILIRDRSTQPSRATSRMTATISDNNIDIDIFNEEDEDENGTPRASTAANSAGASSAASRQTIRSPSDDDVRDQAASSDTSQGPSRKIRSNITSRAGSYAPSRPGSDTNLDGNDESHD